MNVLIGRLVSGPKGFEIVDLLPGSPSQIHEFLSDLVSTFGIERAAPSDSFPMPLGPDELRELNAQAGRKLTSQFSLNLE